MAMATGCSWLGGEAEMAIDEAQETIDHSSYVPESST